MMRPISLVPHLNNTGLTDEDGLGGGGFNIWGNTFPAGELPPAGGTTVVHDVPFLFPVAGVDNVRCRGQRVDVPPGRWDWVHVLGASERRTEDLLEVHYSDGSVRGQWLRMSDFWPQTEPRFGEVLAFRCRHMHYPRHVQRTMSPSIWAQRVPVTVPSDVVALVLPDNPALHVFALTLQAVG